MQINKIKAQRPKLSACKKAQFAGTKAEKLICQRRFAEADAILAPPIETLTVNGWYPELRQRLLFMWAVSQCVQGHLLEGRRLLQELSECANEPDLKERIAFSLATIDKELFPHAGNSKLQLVSSSST